MLWCRWAVHRQPRFSPAQCNTIGPTMCRAPPSTARSRPCRLGDQPPSPKFREHLEHLLECDRQLLHGAPSGLLIPCSVAECLVNARTVIRICKSASCVFCFRRTGRVGPSTVRKLPRTLARPRHVRRACVPQLAQWGQCVISRGFSNQRGGIEITRERDVKVAYPLFADCPGSAPSLY